ncbi:hypothetical protein [Erwinia phage Zoomie]|uniref:Uncharacterized protein n=1 Tax=Erwinia phage Zoomie TaxID=2851072 RepID=A0A9E6T3D9_9CAUD|nr:hypothetical protein [Erwinia phage Zoomie]
MRKVTFIDPNDNKKTYGLLNADNTEYRILVSKAAQASTASSIKAGEDSLYSVDADIHFSSGLQRALKAMLEQNPVA